MDIYVRGETKIPSNSFSSTKMTCDILFHTLSASKMSSTRCIIQKKKEKGYGWGGRRDITVPQNCFDFTASVPFLNYLHKCHEHSSTA